jgi:hypothetical protein
VRTLVPIVCIILSEEETIQSLFLVSSFYWIVFLLCQRVPYYNATVGKTMAGCYSVLLWCSMCLMLAVMRQNNTDNSMVPSIVMASGCCFAFAVGACLYKKRDDSYSTWPCCLPLSAQLPPRHGVLTVLRSAARLALGSSPTDSPVVVASATVHEYYMLDSGFRHRKRRMGVDPPVVNMDGVALEEEGSDSSDEEETLGVSGAGGVTIVKPIGASRKYRPMSGRNNLRFLTEVYVVYI